MENSFRFDRLPFTFPANPPCLLRSNNQPTENLAFSFHHANTLCHSKFGKDSMDGRSIEKSAAEHVTKVELESRELWTLFYEQCNEMVITKSGR